jgi:hypothetical protein
MTSSLPTATEGSGSAVAGPLRRAGVLATGAVVALLASLLVPAGPAAAQSAPLPERVWASSERNDHPNKQAIAWCPNGTVVIGGGFYFDGPSLFEPVLSALRPVSEAGRSGFLARAFNPTPTTDPLEADWDVNVAALCIPRPRGYGVVPHTWTTTHGALDTQSVGDSPMRGVRWQCRLLGLMVTRPCGASIATDDSAPRTPLISLDPARRMAPARRCTAR